MLLPEEIDPVENQIQIVVVQGVPDEQEGVVDEQRADKGRDQRVILLVVQVVALLDDHRPRVLDVAVHLDQIPVRRHREQVGVLGDDGVKPGVQRLGPLQQIVDVGGDDVVGADLENQLVDGVGRRVAGQNLGDRPVIIDVIRGGVLLVEILGNPQVDFGVKRRVTVEVRRQLQRDLADHLLPGRQPRIGRHPRAHENHQLIFRLGPLNRPNRMNPIHCIIFLSRSRISILYLG